MANYVELNSGSGGDKIAAYESADGYKHSVAVASIVTTIAPGANVIAPVSATNPLPIAATGTFTVVSGTAANLKALVSLESGSTVALASGTTVAATQSGAWSVGVTGSVTVQQSTAASLKSEVSQATAANLNATVSQGGSWTVAATQSGAWSVTQATAANLKTEATLASGSAVALNAGTALVGKVSAGVDVAALYNGATALTPKYAKIAASSSGNNAVVAAVAGKKIRVLRWGLTAAGAVSVKWVSGAATDLTGVRKLTEFASAGGAYCPIGVFETAAGDALNVNLSVAMSVGGELTYVEV